MGCTLNAVRNGLGPGTCALLSNTSQNVEAHACRVSRLRVSAEEREYLVLG